MFTARDRLKLLAGGAASALISGCGGSSSSPTVPPVIVTPPTPPTPVTFTPTPGQFKNAFTNNFLIGAAVQRNQVDSATDDQAILIDQFNSITAEYEMKPDIIAPTEGAYDWSRPDALINFAEANNIALRGHALLWHLTTPDWMLSGTPAEVKAKLQTYVTDVVTRYRGRIYAWDVVNEVITDENNTADPYRRSNWWTASGGNADYIDWAFEAARAADPDCKLYINDYSTEFAGKRGRLLDVVRDLQARNIPVDGIGHQMHVNVSTPASQVLEALDDVEAAFMGMEQHITELDVSVYSDPGSCFSDQTGCQADYGTAIPATALRDQAQLYRALFEGFKTRTSLTSVTVWGVSDAQSWLDRYPIDRTNAPLLWDRDRDAKSALQAILDPDFTP
jgi:endo-1,4-beta-xylanase